MLEKLAVKVATALYVNLNEKQMLVINSNGKAYKTILIKLKFIIILICLLISIFLIGHFFKSTQELLLGSLFFFIMRYINDGHHFKTVDLCFLVTLSVILSIPIIHYLLANYTLILSILSILLNLVFAPFKYQKTKRSFYTKKTISNIICIIGYFLGSLASTAIFLQALDLIHNIKTKKRVI